MQVLMKACMCASMYASERVHVCMYTVYLMSIINYMIVQAGILYVCELVWRGINV